MRMGSHAWQILAALASARIDHSATMASMLACQRPAALRRPCSSSSLQARPAAGLAQQLPSRPQQPSQRNAQLLRPAGLGSPRRSSRPVTVAQAGQQQGAGACGDVCGPVTMRAGAMRQPPGTAATPPAPLSAAALSPHPPQSWQQQQRSLRSRAAAWGARSRWRCCSALGTCSTSSSTCESAHSVSHRAQKHLSLAGQGGTQGALL